MTLWILTVSPCLAVSPYLYIDAPADGTTFCVGQMLAAGQLKVHSDVTLESVSYMRVSAAAVPVAMSGGPDYVSSENVVFSEPGWYDIAAMSGGETAHAQVAVMQLVGMDVSSPASSLGGDNSDQFAVVKQSGCVLVVANLLPEMPQQGTDVVGNMLVWSGTGFEDTVVPRVKAVPTTEPLEAAVAASVCNAIHARKVWVIWGQITYNFSDAHDDDNNLSHSNPGLLIPWPEPTSAGSHVGPVTDSNGNSLLAWATKVEIIGTLEPTGVGAVLGGDLSFNDQTRTVNYWLLQSAPGYRDESLPSAPDMPGFIDNLTQQIVPVNDKIFAIDAPAMVLPGNSADGWIGVANNFINHIYYRGVAISDPKRWHSFIRGNVSSGTATTLSLNFEEDLVGNPVLPEYWTDDLW